MPQDTPDRTAFAPTPLARQPAQYPHDLEEALRELRAVVGTPHPLLDRQETTAAPADLAAQLATHAERASRLEATIRHVHGILGRAIGDA